MKKLLIAIVIASYLSSSMVGMDVSIGKKRSATDAQLTESDKAVRKCLFLAIEDQADPVHIERLLRVTDVNAQDEEEETPLFGAIRHNLDSVELLLKYRSDVNIQNSADMTPLLLMASLSFCEDYGNQEDNDNFPDDFFPGSFVGSEEEHFKKIISTAKLLMENGTNTTLVDENDDTVITLLDGPCTHYEALQQGKICEDCAVNHTCHTCARSHQLLGTIQEQLAYRAHAPRVIKTALEECHTGDWASLSPIIAGYLTAIAPLPQKDTLAPTF